MATGKTKRSDSPPDPPAALCNPLNELLGYNMRRASLAMFDDLSDALQDLELRPTTASILMLIEANPGITQSRMGQILAIERANMAPLAARLGKLGLVARRRADGRSQGLHMTSKGTQVLHQVRGRIAAHERKFLSGGGPARRESLIEALQALWIRAP